MVNLLSTGYCLTVLCLVINSASSYDFKTANDRSVGSQLTLRNLYELLTAKRSQTDINRYLMEVLKVPGYVPDMSPTALNDLLQVDADGRSDFNKVYTALFHALIKAVMQNKSVDKAVLDYYRVCELCDYRCRRYNSCSDVCCSFAAPNRASVGCPGNTAGTTPVGCNRQRR